MSDVDGLGALETWLRARMRTAGVAALHAIGAAGVEAVRARLDSPGGGAPVSRSGELRDSIAHRVDAGTMTLVISAGSPHAAPLEFGTERMSPHPFMRSTIYTMASSDVFSRCVTTAWGSSPA